MSVYSTKVTSEPVAAPNVETNQPAGKVSNVEVVKSEIQPAASVYETVNGIPYAAKYFKIDYWKDLNDELDVNLVRDKVKTIDKYILQEIKEMNLEDSTIVYDEIMRKIGNQISLNDKEKPESKLERFSEYIKILTKQRKLDKERRDFYGKFTNARTTAIFI